MTEQKRRFGWVRLRGRSVGVARLGCLSVLMAGSVRAAMMRPPPTRFARSGEARIAFQVFGEGPLVRPDRQERWA